MDKKRIILNVNGEELEVEIEPHRTLLEVLREDLDLTGAKEGCGLGSCGACTVLIDGEPILSCLTLAVEVQHREIVTIEGLFKDGHPHPLQRSFVERGAIQCGYCTPGMILSAKALIDKKGNPSRNEIQEALSGNLCRCTGYNKIVEAVESVGENELHPKNIGKQIQ
jgi:aerobic-type carbon monoxide dehydrogenase small subunit (CoxS/CutS family)